MQLPEILTLLVALVAFPTNWLVCLRLILLSRKEPGLRVLRERAIASVFLSMTVTAFGLVFLNNNMETPLLDVFQTQIITRSVILLLTVPALYWLWLYRRD